MSRCFVRPCHPRAPSSVLRAVLAAAVLAAFGSPAVTRAENRQQAEQLVREALSHEMLGLGDARQRLLEAAVEAAPDYAPAQWHQGRVCVDGDWRAVDGDVESDQQRNRREQYEQKRAAAPDTADGQLALADWCDARGLRQQEIAHLNRVIQWEPNNIAARQRLDQRPVDGRWVAGEDLWRGLRDRRQVLAAIQKWRPRLLQIAVRAESLDSTQWAEQLQKLAGELNAEAVPAIEAVLATRSDMAAQMAVDVLSEMPGHEASQGLARMAVLSPWAEARSAAAEQLGARPLDHFVPLLLSELSTPVDSRINAALVGGELLFRQTFEQEFQDRREMVVLDTELRSRFGLGRPTMLLRGRSTRTTESEASIAARTAVQQIATAREQLRMQRNAWIGEMNDRIGIALRTATGQDLPPAAQAWWSWWDEENEITMTGEKYTSVRYNRDVQVYSDRRTRCECFIAGTPVWTIAGARPIEQLQIGDLVLSQDVASGELDYRPVLQTTTRPAEPLVRITLAAPDRETIEGSGGHPLWSAGDGWVLLRKINSGTILHGIGGSAIVSDTAEGRVAETYNLIVDDFHTYVVGQAKIICHDNTPRRPCDAIVPGLIPQ